MAEKVKAPVNTEKKKMTRDELHRYADKMKAYDEELLVGIFENKENPGGTVEFCFKGQWKGSPFERWYLRDGHRYQIPRGVVRHINKECAVNVYKEIAKNGQLIADTPSRAVMESCVGGRYDVQSKLVERKSRFRFVPLDFMDDDIYPDQIALVETGIRG